MIVAKVVVFIPPPVPPGEAPININITIINKVASFNVAILTVLKPAVLVVIDWKKLARTFVPPDIFPIDLGLLNSIRKNTRAPAIIKRAVTNNTILACRENFLSLRYSINSEITENLREISKALMVVSRKAVTMGGYFDNPIPTEVGQSLARIEKIKSKLE